MNADQTARRDALVAGQSTASLILSAQLLEAVGYANLKGSERLTLAWLSDAIAERAGGLPTSGPESDRFDALLDEGKSYVDALLAFFPDLPR